jgi:hypothetical protein
MADRKISDLTALTTPASGDFLPIVDISEAALDTKNKRITIEELMRGMPDGTAAAPGIAFESDPNTGFWSPAADTLAASTGGAEAIRINNQRELLIGTTTRTANGGVLQVSNGITFPATAVACTNVNTLDDYEEGTWTPQLTGFTMSGSNQGKYIKVGRIVTVEAVLQWSSGTSPGTALVTGLPFVNSGGVRSTGAFGLSNGASIIPTAGFTWLTTHIDVAASTVQIIQNGITGNNGAVTIASSGTVFAFGLTYLST